MRGDICPDDCRECIDGCAGQGGLLVRRGGDSILRGGEFIFGCVSRLFQFKRPGLCYASVYFDHSDLVLCETILPSGPLALEEVQLDRDATLNGRAACPSKVLHINISSFY
jgi:hypothetical protein